MVSINTGRAVYCWIRTPVGRQRGINVSCPRPLAQSWETLMTVHTEAMDKAAVKERDIKAGVECVCTIDEPHLV